MKARELMMDMPAVVTPSSELTKAAALVRDRNVGIVPVVEDARSMRLVGVLTDRHMLVRCTAKHHGRPCDAAHHMLAFVEPVHADDSADDVLSQMDRVRLRHLPVVDESERVIGIIGQGDVLRDLAR